MRTEQSDRASASALAEELGDLPLALALGVVLLLVVLLLNALIAWVRHRYMDSPWDRSLVQVVIGGLLVFLTGSS